MSHLPGEPRGGPSLVSSVAPSVPEGTCPNPRSGGVTSTKEVDWRPGVAREGGAAGEQDPQMAVSRRDQGQSVALIQGALAGQFSVRIGRSEFLAQHYLRCRLSREQHAS